MTRPAHIALFILAFVFSAAGRNTLAATVLNRAFGQRILKLRREIDAGKVGIAGRGQGGWIAPLAPARSGDAAFVILS